MPEATPLVLILIEGSMSTARLHGEARCGCGTVAKELRVAAHGARRGSTHVWQITTDGQHRNEAVAA
ncbi:hypothetical protein ACFXKC_21290 [Streptomyces sp. NPDC059340]|uniref:hypothetical protein n=1 Tax=Streptomyces sp. NPDC059340 TaxID=3346806 RepID=UPI003679BB87